MGEIDLEPEERFVAERAMLTETLESGFLGQGIVLGAALSQSEGHRQCYCMTYGITEAPVSHESNFSGPRPLHARRSAILARPIRRGSGGMAEGRLA